MGFECDRVGIAPAHGSTALTMTGVPSILDPRSSILDPLFSILDLSILDPLFSIFDLSILHPLFSILDSLPSPPEADELYRHSVVESLGTHVAHQRSYQEQAAAAVS